MAGVTRCFWMTVSFLCSFFMSHLPTGSVDVFDDSVGHMDDQCSQDHVSGENEPSNNQGHFRTYVQDFRGAFYDGLRHRSIQDTEDDHRQQYVGRRHLLHRYLLLGNITAKAVNLSLRYVPTIQGTNLETIFIYKFVPCTDLFNELIFPSESTNLVNKLRRGANWCWPRGGGTCGEVGPWSAVGLDVGRDGFDDLVAEPDQEPGDGGGHGHEDQRAAGADHDGRFQLDAEEPEQVEADAHDGESCHDDSTVDYREMVTSDFLHDIHPSVVPLPVSRHKSGGEMLGF